MKYIIHPCFWLAVGWKIPAKAWHLGTRHSPPHQGVHLHHNWKCHARGRTWKSRTVSTSEFPNGIWNLEGRNDGFFCCCLKKNQPRWHMINFYTAPIFTPSTSFRSISMYGKGGRLHGQWTADTFNADTLSSSNFVSCLHGTISDDTND